MTWHRPVIVVDPMTLFSDWHAAQRPRNLPLLDAGQHCGPVDDRAANDNIQTVRCDLTRVELIDIVTTIAAYGSPLLRDC